MPTCDRTQDRHFHPTRVGAGVGRFPCLDSRQWHCPGPLVHKGCLHSHERPLPLQLQPARDNRSRPSRASWPSRASSAHWVPISPGVRGCPWRGQRSLAFLKLPVASLLAFMTCVLPGIPDSPGGVTCSSPRSQ